MCRQTSMIRLMFVCTCEASESVGGRSRTRTMLRVVDSGTLALPSEYCVASRWSHIRRDSPGRTVPRLCTRSEVLHLLHAVGAGWVCILRFCRSLSERSLSMDPFCSAKRPQNGCAKSPTPWSDISSRCIVLCTPSNWCGGLPSRVHGIWSGTRSPQAHPRRQASPDCHEELASTTMEEAQIG